MSAPSPLGTGAGPGSSGRCPASTVTVCSSCRSFYADDDRFRIAGARSVPPSPISLLKSFSSSTGHLSGTPTAAANVGGYADVVIAVYDGHDLRPAAQFRHHGSGLRAAATSSGSVSIPGTPPASAHRRKHLPLSAPRRPIRPGAPYRSQVATSRAGRPSASRAACRRGRPRPSPERNLRQHLDQRE